MTPMHIPSASNRPARLIQSAGFTLIELLIAIALMLLVLTAVTAIYVPSRQLNVAQNAVSTMTDDGLIATETLSREFRHAQHLGCPSLGESSSGRRNVSSNAIDAVGGINAFKFTPAASFRVLTVGDSGTPTAAISGTPVLEVITAANGGSQLLAPMTNRNTMAVPIMLRTDPGIKIPSSLTATNTAPVALIGDCNSNEMFTVFNVVTASTGGWTISANEGALRTLYGTDAKVSPVLRTQYFVQTYSGGDTRSTTALYKRTSTADARFWNSAQPLVMDVVSWSVTGLDDTNGDGLADGIVALPRASGADTISTLRIVLNLESASKTGTDGATLKRSFSPSILIRARAS